MDFRNILSEKTVLVLNRNWQAIDCKTPAEAFLMVAAGAATPLDIGDNGMTPVPWDKWLLLPVRETDRFVRTVKGVVRCPTVVVAANFSKVPLRRPRFSRESIWERDRGTCQYTGKKLRKGEGNVDHVVPRAKGGATSWDNCVLSDKKINSIKGTLTPKEAGLSLIKKPEAPKPLPPVAFIKNTHGVEDWEHFLIK